MVFHMFRFVGSLSFFNRISGVKGIFIVKDLHSTGYQEIYNETSQFG